MQPKPAARNERAWKRHAGDFSWVTIALGLATMVLAAAAWTAGLTGAVSLWVAGGMMFVAAYVGFTVMHEAAHGNIVGPHAHLSWIGTGLGWGCGLLLLAPYPAFRLLHLRHHAKTNHVGHDPDLWVAGSRWWSIALRCASILGHYYVVFLTGRLGDRPAVRQARNVAVATVVAIIATVALLASVSSLGVVLALWVLPAWAASTVLAFAFDWLPHHPHTVAKRMHDTRIVIVPGLWLPMLWQNYHLVHHLYPRVPFYRYARCYADCEGALEQAEAPIVAWPAPARS